MSILNKTLWRLQQYKSNRIALHAIQALSEPKVVADFLRFDLFLTEATKTRLEPLFRLRLLELDRLIRRHAVRSICEMGSGRTTFFFNLFRDIDVVSYEQDERWRLLLLEFHATHGLRLPRIVASQVEHYRDGGRFVAIENRPCDLLYIDGPYVGSAPGKLPTHTGKPAYFDFERVLEAGLPKLIMVEGRTDTVDAILASPYSRHYAFQGELTWALERGRYAHAARLRRHSIFVVKNAA
jgi:hypothetical protein